MGTVLATIALAAGFAVQVAWGQGVVSGSKAVPKPPLVGVTSLPLPEAPTREPTAEEVARWSKPTKDTAKVGEVDPTLGLLSCILGTPSEVIPAHFQAYFGDEYVVTPIPRGESTMLIFVRRKDGAAIATRPPDSWFGDLADARRRTDIVGERARAYQDPRPLDFPGGTVEQFLTTIFPPSLGVEIIYQSDAVRLERIGPLSVKSIIPKDAINLLGRLYGTRFRIDALRQDRPDIGPGGTLLNYDPMLPLMLVVTGVRDARGVARVSMEPSVVRLPPASASAEAVRKEQERHQDEILRAIADGIALRGGPSSTFKLKLNPSTGILFVLGSSEEQDLVRNVARALMPEGAQPNDDDAASGATPNTPSSPSSGPTPTETKPPTRPKLPAPTP
ncbi:MAG: hypothetical protein U0625_01740 [Phycisphaerales bacterium]